MPPTRRALLAALAASGLAGCSTGPGTGADGSTPDGTTTASRATTAPGTTSSDADTATAADPEDPPDTGGTTTDAEAMAADVDLGVAAAFDSYFYREGPELVAVAGDGEQYLLAELSVPEGVAPAAGQFAVEAGDTAYPMTYEPRGAVPEVGPFDQGRRYRSGRSGWLAAALSTSLPAAPAVTFRERSWPVPDGPARRLTDPAPSFSVTSFEAPGRVRPGDPYEVRLTLRNDGGAGSFRAALNWAGERTVTTVELDVPAGGRARWQAGADVPPGDATAMALVTTGRTIERSVTVDG